MVAAAKANAAEVSAGGAAIPARVALGDIHPDAVLADPDQDRPTHPLAGLLQQPGDSLDGLLALVQHAHTIGRTGVEVERQRVSRLNYAQNLGNLLTLSPAEFEQTVGTILAAHGFREVQVVGGAGDLAADITCIDSQGRSVIVQCKRYGPGHSAGSPDVQKLIGMATVHHGAARSILVTTASYTAPALELARRHGVDLIDGLRLTTMAASARKYDKSLEG